MWPAIKMLVVFVVVGVPAAIVGIPLSAIRKDFSTMYRWGMWACAAGVRAAGIRVQVLGRENIPPGKSCIFLSNHQSNLDPPILLPAIPGMASVFLKKSLMSIPLLGTAMRMGKYVPVSRGHSREEAQKSVAAAVDALQSGLHIMVFPEGTRSPDGHLQAFKKGAFFLAAETGAPMVPVVLSGTARMMRKGSLKVFPGVATVRFLPALMPADYATREDLMDAVRDRILRAMEQPAT
jgi:1-acyl-sn-glycerol-3-phosphate acyltransferase